MPMMTGEAYRRSLLDGRRCCIDGELITDPSQHPMLKTAVDSVGRRDGGVVIAHVIRDLTADTFGGWDKVTNQVVGGGMHRMLALDSFDLAPVKARARAAGVAS